MPKTKKIKRRATWRACNEDWCPNCAKVVDMEYIPGLKGLPNIKCPECLTNYQINLLESGDDLLEVPSNYDFKINKK